MNKRHRWKTILDIIQLIAVTPSHNIYVQIKDRSITLD